MTDPYASEERARYDPDSWDTTVVEVADPCSPPCGWRHYERIPLTPHITAAEWTTEARAEVRRVLDHPNPDPLTPEDREWLDAPIGPPLEPYDEPAHVTPVGCWLLAAAVIAALVFAAWRMSR